MKVSITCDDFPVSAVGKLAEEVSSYGISASVQVGGDDTLFISANIDDITKVQVFCILVDKYKFYERSEYDGEVLHQDAPRIRDG